MAMPDERYRSVTTARARSRETYAYEKWSHDVPPDSTGGSSGPRGRAQYRSAEVGIKRIPPTQRPKLIDTPEALPRGTRRSQRASDAGHRSGGGSRWAVPQAGRRWERASAYGVGCREDGHREAASFNTRMPRIRCEHSETTKDHSRRRFDFHRASRHTASC
jgi:hypothetical protein